MTTTDQPTPAQARHYIENFKKHTMPGMEFVDFPSGRFHLDDMTDERDKMVGCLDGFFAWLATEPGSAEEDRALTEAQDLCRDAGY